MPTTRVRMALCIAAVLALTAVAAPAALADVETGFVIGATVGSASQTQEFPEFDVDLDGDDFAWHLLAGYRLKFVGFELGYRDFGQVDAQTADGDFATSTTGVDIYAVGYLPLGPFDLFAKGGIVWWDREVDSPDVTGSASRSDFAWGVGAQFRLRRLAIRVEYEQFQIDSGDLNAISAGVSFTF